MKDTLEEFIRLKVEHPNKQELQEILDLFQFIKFKKGDFFKKSFTISSEIGFLVNGAVRFLLYKDNGEKITVRVIQEPTFITDFISLKDNQATPMGIECLEDVSMFIAPSNKIQELLKTNLSLNILIREHLVMQALALSKSYLLFLTGTARDRYLFILENDPSLLKKLPLRLIAQLIGITPTQLSRIRNKKSD